MSHGPNDQLSKLSYIATAIGSVPFSEPAEAVSFVLSKFRDAPFWPQLPARSPLEDMNLQYAANLPGIRSNEEKRSLTVVRDEGFDAAVEEFYARILEDDVKSFDLPVERAAGFYEFLRGIDAHPEKDEISFLKGHITGPITHGLIIRDEQDKPVIYDHLYSDLIVKNLVMQARSQVNFFENHLPHAGRIIFIDEPYLTAFGSAFVSLDENFVIEKLDEIAEATSAICAVHCCGRTDWKTLLSTKVDMLSFDAYEYMESLATFPGEVNAFLERGGVLSWGIVPSSLPTPIQIEQEDLDTLEKKFHAGLGVLERAGVNLDLVNKQSIITPSCGTGGMSEANAKKALTLAGELAARLKKRSLEGAGAAG